MKRFTLENVNTVEEAVSSLGGHGDKAKVIAGGTDLLGTLKTQINPTYPEVLVNLMTIPGLDSIKEEGGMLKMGALAKITDIYESSIVKSKYPALSQAAHAVASLPLRNQGTLGGNLCQECRCWYYRVPRNRFFCFRKGGTLCFAVPGDNRYNAILGGQVCFAVCPSDTAIALTALDATIVTSDRNIPIGDFFAVLGNKLDDDEVVTEIQVSEPKSGTKQTFMKFRLRKQIDFAISSVATAITVEAGNVTDARIVLGGVAPVPYRAVDAEDSLKGNAITESAAEAAASAAIKDALLLSHNAWLVPVTEALVKRAILS